ncbi:RICIN domain-containing protein [uncultured Pseudoramibacter sp.]|uniref:RICIN domain-containing protein n=1 Tax=uncultured Pseudoramibacter sp. TaxID=1623493 RepID=UPI0025E71CEE|nr:RICIN domain-containing protein [uncultured Pseudoramibacter sp.]
MSVSKLRAKNIVFILSLLFISLLLFIPQSVNAAESLPEDSFTAQILVGDKAVSRDSDNVIVLETNQYSQDQYWEFIPIGDGQYKIINKGTQKALDVSGASDKNGANIQIYSDNGSDAQKWTLNLESDGSYTLQPACSNDKVMDVTGGKINTNGTNVQLYQENNTAAQKFKIVIGNPVNGSTDLGTNFYARLTSSGRSLSVAGSNVVIDNTQISKNQVWKFELNKSSNTYTITNCANRKALDVSGAIDKDGTNIQTYPANQTNAQKWYLLKRDDGSYTLRPAMSGSRSVDIAGNSSNIGTNVQLYRMNNSSAQSFNVEKTNDEQQLPTADVGTGFIAKLVNSGNGKVLTESGDSQVVQASSANIKQQLWKFELTDGVYKITNQASGKVLDVSGAWDVNGTAIQTYSSNDTKAQRWKIEKNGSSYNLKPECSTNRVLDITGDSSSEGTKAQLYTSNGTKAQAFTIEKVTDISSYIQANDIGDNITSRITNVKSGKSLTINGNGITQNTKSTSYAQGWILKRNADLSYTIVNIGDNSKALDVVGGANSQADVQVYTTNGTKAQKWLIVKSSDHYALVPECATGYALDVSGGSTEDNARLQIYSNNNTQAQQFDINRASASEFASAVYAGGLGFDVSEWQGYISADNWRKAKNAGYSFAMLRIAWGHAGNGAMDKQFNNNYENATKAGMPFGVYVYSYADDEKEARQEADYAISLLNGRSLKMPICIDLEDDRISYLSKTQQSKNAIAFCEEVKKAGYTPMIYANQNWLNNHLNYSMIKNYKIWYAQYPYSWNSSSKPQYSNHIDIWQYSDRGSVPGLSGSIDMNKAYSSF